MAQLSDTELLKQIANRIKELRKEKGVTQEAFYNDTNIHIARIERGKTNISISTLNAICNYFEITLKEFFI
ncbi:MAG: helix-turn-helix transcriptional regulator [Flavobacteriales bacterium]|nr:helix-turn-helix transcriptional regulator [Flavobacteriales bacterium]